RCPRRRSSVRSASTTERRTRPRRLALGRLDCYRGTAAAQGSRPRRSMMLDERKAAILRAVVEEYIDTAQPVGSAHVARARGVDVSPATVRNEMAGLEAEGY